MKKTRIIFLVIGCLILFVLFYSFGVKQTIAHILEMGWKFWLIVLIYILNSINLTFAWRLIFSNKHKPPSFLKLFLARVAGDSGGAINAAGSIAGESVKALYLRDDVPLKAALASVVLDRTIHSIANILIIISGLILSLFVFKIPATVNLTITLLLVIAIWIIIKILKKQRDGLAEYVLNKLPTRVANSFMNEERWEKVKKLDEEIAHIFSSKRTLRRFWAALLIRYLSIILAGTFEIYLILKFIGSPVLLIDSVFTFVFGLFLTSAMFFMPANLGTSEGAYSLVLKFMGYDPVLGLSVGIIRRLRSFVMASFGVLILFHAGLLKRKK